MSRGGPLSKRKSKGKKQRERGRNEVDSKGVLRREKIGGGGGQRLSINGKYWRKRERKKDNGKLHKDLRKQRSLTEGRKPQCTTEREAETRKR